MPTVLVAILWIGGSYLAGMFASWQLMAPIAVASAVVFVTVIKMELALDSELFADPLSILAVPSLVAGELLALYIGSERTRSRAA